MMHEGRVVSQSRQWYTQTFVRRKQVYSPVDQPILTAMKHVTETYMFETQVIEL